MLPMSLPYFAPPQLRPSESSLSIKKIRVSPARGWKCCTGCRRHPSAAAGSPPGGHAALLCLDTMYTAVPAHPDEPAQYNSPGCQLSTIRVAWMRTPSS